jgi:hypothetical protein
MKYLHQLTIWIILIIVISFSSCKKLTIETPEKAAFSIGNFVIGGQSVKTGSLPLSSINNSGEPPIYGLHVGEHNLYVWPLGDSLHPYYTQPKFECKANEVYTLFLHGPVAAPEGFIVKESIPYRTDSTAGIRFINLSPNSTPLNITLSTSTTVNEVSNLAYKDKTEFKSYPALYNSTYTFQVRAANNPNTVLTSFALAANAVPRFANITLVIRGMVGTTPALGVTRMNNDR